MDSKPTAPTADSLADLVKIYSEKEHRALDAILGDVEFLAERRSFGPAITRFIEYQRRFRRHMLFEEDVIFPLVLTDTRPTDELITALRKQHDELDAQTDLAVKALTSSQHHAFFAALDGLDAAVREHNRLEEEELIPRVAALMADPGNRQQLMSRLEHAHEAVMLEDRR